MYNMNNVFYSGRIVHFGSWVLENIKLPFEGKTKKTSSINLIAFFFEKWVVIRLFKSINKNNDL